MAKRTIQLEYRTKRTNKLWKHSRAVTVESATIAAVRTLLSFAPRGSRVLIFNGQGLRKATVKLTGRNISVSRV